MSAFKFASRLEASRLESPTQTVQIIEQDNAGSGQISVTTSSPVLPLGNIVGYHNTWLKEKKTADGAFLYKDGKEVQIHVFELKTTVGFKTWTKVLKQFEGVVLDILAMLGVLGSSWNVKIFAYVAFQKDVLSPRSSVAPTVLKTGLGTGKPLLNDLGWSTGSVKILNFSPITLTKIIRDTNGNATTSVML